MAANFASMAAPRYDAITYRGTFVCTLPIAELKPSGNAVLIRRHEGTRVPRTFFVAWWRGFGARVRSAAARGTSHPASATHDAMPYAAVARAIDEERSTAIATRPTLSSP